MVQAEDEMATPGDMETPPATTEEGASPHDSIIGSPAPERMSMTAGSPQPDGEVEAPEVTEAPEAAEPSEEPAMSSPGSPNRAEEDEGLPEEDDATCLVEDIEDEVFTEAEAPPATGKDADGAPDKTEESVCAAESSEEPTAGKEVKARTVEDHLTCVKESAQHAMEAIGNKVTNFFGSLRKVKSMLHIDEAAKNGKGVEETTILSSSTTELDNMTKSVKSRACNIL